MPFVITKTVPEIFGGFIVTFTVLADFLAKASGMLGLSGVQNFFLFVAANSMLFFFLAGVLILYAMIKNLKWAFIIAGVGGIVIWLINVFYK